MKSSVFWCREAVFTAGMRVIDPRCARRRHRGDAAEEPAESLKKLIRRELGKTRQPPFPRDKPPFSLFRASTRNPPVRGSAVSPVLHRTTASLKQISRTRTAKTAGPESLAVLSFRWSGYGSMSTGDLCARDRREKPPRKCRVGKMVSNQKVQGGIQQGTEGFHFQEVACSRLPCLSPRSTSVGSTIFPPITNTAGVKLIPV